MSQPIRVNGTGGPLPVPFGMLTARMREFDGDYVLTDDVWDEALWVWRRTTAPRGCKVEILDGIVTVTPLSSVTHVGVAERLQRRLHEVIPEDWGVYQRLPLAVPARLGLYMPDIAVVASEALRAGDEELIPAAKAELVGEITSRATADNDRIHKLAGYARAGVPFYLLIDGSAPRGPTVTLYGEPEEESYRVLHVGGAGTSVPLPAPFGCTLDTSAFRIR